MEYEQNRRPQIRDEQKLAKVPKALDGKLYILVLQTLMCVVILSVSLVIKTFFTDLYTDTNLFYKEHFKDTTNVDEVLNENTQGATVSVITSEETTANATANQEYGSSSFTSTSSSMAAGGPIDDTMVVFNEIRQTVSPNSFLIPLKSYTVTSRFGERTDPISNTPSTHNGIDLAAEYGDEIVASLTGTVEAAEYNASYGNYVKIRHSAALYTVYAHCSSLKVNKGDKVKAGQVIALVGSTGRSTGPHLHFEVLLNDNKVNPENYIKLK